MPRFRSFKRRRTGRSRSRSRKRRGASVSRSIFKRRRIRPLYRRRRKQRLMSVRRGGGSHMWWKTKTVVRGNDRGLRLFKPVRIGSILPKRRRVLLTQQYAHSGLDVTAGSYDVYGTAVSLMAGLVINCNGSTYGRWSTYKTRSTGVPPANQPNGRDTMFTLYDNCLLLGVHFHLNVLNCEQSTTFAAICASSAGDVQGSGWSRSDFMPPYNKNTLSVRYRQSATIAPTDKIGAFQKTVLKGYFDYGKLTGQTRSIFMSSGLGFESSLADSGLVGVPHINILAMAAEPTPLVASKLSYVLTMTYDVLCLSAKDISTN